MTVHSGKTSETVNVNLGPRSYDIQIGRGILGDVGRMIASQFHSPKCLIVTDQNVDDAHGDTLRNALNKEGIDSSTICLPPGEATKSWKYLQDVVEDCLQFQLDRGDLIVALGGGVIGDLAGFAAAIVRRGVRFVQVPTSLLAQVDSSVGGKTGINTMQGKNLVGAFHQPSSVVIDVDVLKTLPEREFRAGYAEVAKYGLINNPSFFSWLEENQDRIFRHDRELELAIATSCRSKAEIVSADETEQGSRALLNLGHTFGHALEGYTGYDGSRLVHGEAISIGITLAHRFSNRMNLCSDDCVRRVQEHFRKVGLPTKIAEIPGERPGSETLMRFIFQDKKVKGNSLTFILTKGIGKAYIAEDVPESEVNAFLREQMNT